MLCLNERTEKSPHLDSEMDQTPPILRGKNSSKRWTGWTGGRRWGEVIYLIGQAKYLKVDTHLSHLNELDEDFSSELRGGAAENHQLYPLGDAVAQGNRPLHGGVLLHTAIYKVILVVGELEGKERTIRTRLWDTTRNKGKSATIK